MWSNGICRKVSNVYPNSQIHLKIRSLSRFNQNNDLMILNPLQRQMFGLMFQIDEYRSINEW